MVLSIKLKVKAKGEHAEKLAKVLLPKVKRMHAPAGRRGDKHGNPRY